MGKAAAVTIAGEEELAAAIDQLLADPGPAGARAEAFALSTVEQRLKNVPPSDGTPPSTEDVDHPAEADPASGMAAG